MISMVLPWIVLIIFSYFIGNFLARIQYLEEKLK